MAASDSENISAWDAEHYTDCAQKQARNFVFTSWHETPPAFDAEAMQYLLYAPEIAPTTGKKHWQGFVILKMKKLLNPVRKLLKSWAGICRGDLQDNITYIKGPYEKGDKKKPANPEAVEFGSPPQHVNGLLSALADQLKSHELTVSDVIDNNPIAYHLYGRTLHAIADRAEPNIRQPAKLYWFNTHQLDDLKLDSFYTKDSYWDDTYTHEPIMIVDLEKTNWGITDFETLVTSMPFYLQRRYRPRILLTSTTIIIKCKVTPDLYYFKSQKEHWQLNAQDYFDLFENTKGKVWPLPTDDENTHRMREHTHYRSNKRKADAALPSPADGQL